LVLTLSYSRALWLEFFFDQSLENFLLGHVHAFQAWHGCPRMILYDNLRSVVLERRGDAIHFHPRLLELSAHYHFAARPCAVARGNEKGRVERAIRYIRTSFFAARPFTTLEDFNRQAWQWRNTVAHQRRCPGDDTRTVEQVFQEEQPRLLSLPVHAFDTDQVVTMKPGKTIYVRFDLNDYSIPPSAVTPRPLTLVASPTMVRLLDGNTEIARHVRSYDRHQQILDPAHQQALLEEKRHAYASTASARLLQAAPESETLLDAAFHRGESAGRQTTQLLHLLDEYGPQELQRAIHEALQRQTPRASSVAFILQKRRRACRQPHPLPVDLSRHPELEALYVQPHNLEAYDELSQPESQS
jgi:hypothetical protein